MACRWKTIIHWLDMKYQFSSVTQSCPTLCDPMNAARQAPCPSPSPGVHPNSCPLSRWCHPTTSSSVVPFSSCPQSFPASGSFPMSQLSTSGGQSIRVSASASVLPMNTQDWPPLGWTGLISLQSKGLLRVFSNTHSKASILRRSAFFIVQLSHPYMTTGSINECKYFQCDNWLETFLLEEQVQNSQRSETDNLKVGKLEVINAGISINNGLFMGSNLIPVVLTSILDV